MTDDRPDSEDSASDEPPRSQAGRAGSESGDDSRERMADAIVEIRREGWKAAITTGVVDATVAFLVVNLVLVFLEPGWLPGRVPVPASVSGPVGSAVGRDLSAVAVPGTATAAVGLAAATFAVTVWWHVRKPLVEQFESVNPALAEKLRTARDAVEADADSRMARRLYGEVLADLRESSAFALVNVGRLGAMTVVIIALSLATVQVAVLDLALLEQPNATAEGPSEDRGQNYTGLLDGEQVLGDREEVSAGDENETAQIESTGGGRDIDEDRTFPDQGQTGGSSGASSGVDSQQAEFAAPGQVEDAELVREYNQRIRDQDQTGGSDDTAGDDDSNGGN